MASQLKSIKSIGCQIRAIMSIVFRKNSTFHLQAASQKNVHPCYKRHFSYFGITLWCLLPNLLCQIFFEN